MVALWQPTTNKQGSVMSRIGKKPITVPKGVKVELRDRTFKTSGPKGELSWNFPADIDVQFDSAAGQIKVGRKGETAQARALHGLTRALINNMVLGVEKGYSRQLEIYRTGYGCKVQGGKLLLNVGF